MTDVGAGQSPEIRPNAATNAGEFINQLGDAALFNNFQRSGKLDFLDTDAAGNATPNGNQVVYPLDVHTNPEYGQLVHFDIYFKQNPKMEDITSKISNVFDTASNAVSELYSAASDSVAGVADDITSGLGGAVDNILSGDFGSLLGGAGDAVEGVGSSLAGLGTNVGAKILNFVADTSQLPEFANEEIIKDTRLGKADQESKDKITLYLPGGLVNADSLSYTDTDLGFMKSMMEGRLGSLIPGAVNAAAKFTDSLAEIVGGELNTASAFSALTGAVRNPRKEQLFEGVEYRTFDFKFTFRPKNEKEAIDMLTICKLFRFHAYPEINAGLEFYLMPSEFKISFLDINNPSSKKTGQLNAVESYASENAWINKIGRCFLSSVNVTYFPDGSVSTFENGIPTAIDLDLSFTEMEAISRNHIYAGY
jgi:hypothetical protein